MAFVMPELGALAILQTVKEQLADVSWTMALYVNDPQISYTRIKTDFTLAAHIAPVSNFGTFFGAPELDGTGKARMVCPLVQFMQTENVEQRVYGYIVYDDDDNLIMIERAREKWELFLAGQMVEFRDIVFSTHS